MKVGFQIQPARGPPGTPPHARVGPSLVPVVVLKDVIQHFTLRITKGVDRQVVVCGGGGGGSGGGCGGKKGRDGNGHGGVGRRRWKRGTC